MKKIVTFFITALIVSSAYAQESLPSFSLAERNGRVVISWANPYPNVVQLNVQRSYDSLRYFATIFSPEAPQLSQNGYTDNTASSGKLFYRIFYVLPGGDYYFTKSKRAGVYVSASQQDIKLRDLTVGKLQNIDPADERIVTVKMKDAIYKQLPAYVFRTFRDSILKQTKDTMMAINDSLVTLNPYIPKDVWKPSRFIFTNEDGFISIAIPRVEEKIYEVKFFDDNGAPIFEINRVRESPLILDKSTFIHAGWFSFELYEDKKLKEKNKFYLPKDF